MELKLYVALVTPGSSDGVKYGHGGSLYPIRRPRRHQSNIVLIPFALSSAIEPIDTP
jgi:hypothetical protein